MVDNKCEVVADGSLCKVNVFFGLHFSVEIKTSTITCFLISFPLFVTVLVYQSKAYQMDQVRGNVGLLKDVDAMGGSSRASM